MMNKKLPDCPECGLDELYRLPGKATRVQCYACSWDSGILGLNLGDEEDDVIAVAVEEYLIAGEYNDDKPHYDTPGGW